MSHLTSIFTLSYSETFDLYQLLFLLLLNMVLFWDSQQSMGHLWSHSLLLLLHLAHRFYYMYYRENKAPLLAYGLSNYLIRNLVVLIDCFLLWLRWQKYQFLNCLSFLPKLWICFCFLILKYLLFFGFLPILVFSLVRLSNRHYQLPFLLNPDKVYVVCIYFAFL
jgi:hypothetical protein